MGCPLKSKKKRIQEFKDNPRLLKAWIRAGQKWYTSDKYQNGNSKYKFNDAFEAMGYLLYCDNMENFKQKTYGLFGETNWKAELERIFNINLDGI